MLARDEECKVISGMETQLATVFAVVRHAVNLGQGAALQTGIEAAPRLDAEIVIYFDADG